MKATIKGLQKVDYTNKDGKPVNAVIFHVEHKDATVVGSCVEQLFIHSDALENLGCLIPPEKYRDAIGMGLEYEYNRFGRIAGLLITEPANPDSKRP